MDPLFTYDPGMHLAYEDDTPAVEVNVTIRDPKTGTERACTLDNLTNVMWFLVSHDLRPIDERLVEKHELLLPDGERTLGGTEGTAIDGISGQDVMDGWRARQGAYAVDLTVLGDPHLLDELMQ